MSGIANPPFKLTSGGWGIQPIDPIPLSGGTHDTFKVTPQDDIIGGHTTVQITGGQKIRLPWGQDR